MIRTDTPWRMLNLSRSVLLTENPTPHSRKLSVPKPCQRVQHLPLLQISIGSDHGLLKDSNVHVEPLEFPDDEDSLPEVFCYVHVCFLIPYKGISYPTA